jgi:hypothetical protein
MAKYTVYCFKDYDELLDWERERFGRDGKVTNHKWWSDNGRIQILSLYTMDNPPSEEVIDEFDFINCSIDDCKNEKFLQWYKELERKQAEQVKRIKELEETMRKEHEDDPPVFIYPFVVSDKQNS